MTGFEPAASTSRMQPHWVASENSKELPATLISRDTNSDTNILKSRCVWEVGQTDEPRLVSVQVKADSFSSALAMIASLPLSDGEKAEAVRRLMTERLTSTVDGTRDLETIGG